MNVTTAEAVRTKLIESLSLDLVGPHSQSELSEEVLSQSPSRWYLTGFLVPFGANEEQKVDEESTDELDHASEEGHGLDGTTPEKGAARRALFPSSMGLSFLVTKETKELKVTVTWGDYTAEFEASTTPEETTNPAPKTPKSWKRKDRRETLTISLPATQKPKEREIPSSNELYLALSVRPVKDISQFDGFVPKGTRSVSLFVVNRRTPNKDETRDQSFAFQVKIEIESEVPFVPRPNVRDLESNDWDERVADLQYRDAFEFAVGHGVSTHTPMNANGDCHTLTTEWVPLAQVERVAPAGIPNVKLGMDELAQLGDFQGFKNALDPLVSQYREWITKQRTDFSQTHKKRNETVNLLLQRAEIAARRIQEGIDSLTDNQARLAFQIANRVMASSGRQRKGIMQGGDPKTITPAWYPFQLAYILMNLKGLIDPKHHDRESVDLLFFPTGGGKTEAYLGLAAFTLVLRRIRNPGLSSAGVSVLMRYTLRLLTLDQLSRAATLICALEIERQNNVDLLGDWPFEIGLWVGQAATPNEMGKKNDGKQNTARSRTISFQTGTKKTSPIPIENCPWCGTKFSNMSFILSPNKDNPTDLHVKCPSRDCHFSKNNMLPIVAVDEPIYRRLPCFLIATVDKFAAMPWTGQVGLFFGRAERADKHGFYGPCDPNAGTRLEKPLLPPDLVIQDELHLISGPMGTMVGLYESALDELCTWVEGGKSIRPKIIASTATVRRAENQIQALFNRKFVEVFPPPGPNRRDSFFAVTHKTDQSPARAYAGVAAQGRSLKVILLRVYRAMMASAQKWYDANGGNKIKTNPADPYMTLVGYFNSLRELGGSRRIIEDEVSTSLIGYGSRKRVNETEGLFADRTIQYEVVELTSRVPTDEVSEAKRKLALQFFKDDHVDVAIATNMISVGLDITRLGLMVVLGQPKTSAEYIQATSRVGRDVGRGDDKPGLVITILNLHRPRDRSHFERFATYHETFYRNVEATSVTPFSPRALDRGLAGTVVALARQGHLPMMPPKGASLIRTERTRLNAVTEALVRRASEMVNDEEESKELANRIRKRVEDLLDEWAKIAHELHQDGVELQYQTEVGGAKQLLYEFLHPELKSLRVGRQKFRANRSMRDVEPSVNVWVRTLDNQDIEENA